MADITFREYWNEIRELCQGARFAFVEYRQDIHEWLHETIDGHEWVIYTHSNFDVLKHSQNDGYVVDNFGSDGLTNEQGVLNTALLAYGAIYGDCMDAIGDEAPDCEHEECLKKWVETGEGECIQEEEEEEGGNL